MLYAVNVTICAEKEVFLEAKSKADAAAKARKHVSSRKHLLEDGEFIVLCGTSQARVLKESLK